MVGTPPPLRRLTSGQVTTKYPTSTPYLLFYERTADDVAPAPPPAPCTSGPARTGAKRPAEEAGNGGARRASKRRTPSTFRRQASAQAVQTAGPAQPL